MFAWTNQFCLLQLALVSSSWHRSLMQRLDSVLSSCALFAWVKRTHKLGLLTASKRHNLPERLQGYELSDHQFDQISAVALAMYSWRSRQPSPKDTVTPTLSISYIPIVRITTINGGFEKFWDKHYLRSTRRGGFFVLHRCISLPVIVSHKTDRFGMARSRSSPCLRYCESQIRAVYWKQM